MSVIHQIETLVRDRGVVVRDTHVRLSSGVCSDAYINKDALYVYPQDAAFLGSAMAGRFSRLSSEIRGSIQGVVGPPVGGAILAQWTALAWTHLLDGRSTFAAYVDKVDGGRRFELRRGYRELVANKEVLVVDDVVSSGASMQKTVEAVIAAGGRVRFAGAFWNRNQVSPTDIGVHVLESLVNEWFISWPEGTCPLCRIGIEFDERFL